MTIWNTAWTLDGLNELSKNSIVEQIGICFVEIGDDYIKATMPVDHRTIQPAGILHGGASVVLAETLGSMAGNMVVGEGYYCVGLEVNANHLIKAVKGNVYGTAEAVHLGGSTQVWNIRIENQERKLICICRLTLAVIKSGD